MGEAFDHQGGKLGEAYGQTKREVFDKLAEAFPDAVEIRIRTLRSHSAGFVVEAEMPRYKCHKEVRALKIAAIECDNTALARDTDLVAIITPTDLRYAAFLVDAAYVRKHEPSVGGYFVVYNDGYQSFSPAEAFESGYTLLDL